MGALEEAQREAVRDPRLRARAEKRARVRRGWTAEEDSRIWRVVHARSGAAGGANSRDSSAIAKTRCATGTSVSQSARRRRRAAAARRWRRRQRRRRRRCRRCWAGVACGRRQRRRRLRRRWHAMAPHRRTPPGSEHAQRASPLQPAAARHIAGGERSKGAERTPGEGQGQGQVQSQEHEREGESEAECASCNDAVNAPY